MVTRSAVKAERVNLVNSLCVLHLWRYILGVVVRQILRESNLSDMMMAYCLHAATAVHTQHHRPRPVYPLDPLLHVHLQACGEFHLAHSAVARCRMLWASAFGHDARGLHIESEIPVNSLGEFEVPVPELSFEPALECSERRRELAKLPFRTIYIPGPEYHWQRSMASPGIF